MATIKFRWSVDELDNVMTLYNTQRVFRAAAATGPWVEITGPGTRVALVEDQTAYFYDDLTGAPGYYYCVDYYDSATFASSDKSVPVRVDSPGYLTVSDVRLEGYTATMVTDDQVARGIARASNLIDRVTRQWFEPRARTFRLDGNDGEHLFLEVPVIKIDSITHWDTTIGLDEIWVPNRHLTQGLLAPDDRANPMITFRDEVLSESLHRDPTFPARWTKGHGNVVLTGVFGYTDLEAMDVPTETAPGSQIPVTYGTTPEQIKRACLLLTVRYMYPHASGAGEDARMRARIIGESTRDQSYTLGSAGVGDNSYGLTGDIEVDNILMGFMAPVYFGVV